METVYMESKSEESGLDELMRLSRQTARQAKDMADAEQQRQEQRERARSIRQGLKEISVSVALQQLKLVAPEKVVEEINALAEKPDIGDLRKLISDLVHDLEKRTGRAAASKTDISTIVNPVKTLAILIELYFALSD
jgi:hypothetical protein